MTNYQLQRSCHLQRQRIPHWWYHVVRIEMDHQDRAIHLQLDDDSLLKMTHRILASDFRPIWHVSNLLMRITD